MKWTQKIEKSIPDHLHEDLLKILLLGSVMAVVGLSSLLPQFAHSVDGETHLYRCGWGTIAAMGGFFSILELFGWFVWRRKGDCFGLIFFIAIPIFGYLFLPDMFTTRVEVSPTHLVHYRMLPGNNIDVNVPFSDVATAHRIQRGAPNVGTTTIGYVLGLKMRPPINIPTNEVVAGAHREIDSRLEASGVSITPVVVHNDQEYKDVVARLLKDLSAAAP